MERATCNCCRRSLDVDQLHSVKVEAMTHELGMTRESDSVLNLDTFCLCKSCMELVRMQLQALSTRICSGFTR